MRPGDDELSGVAVRGDLLGDVVAVWAEHLSHHVGPQLRELLLADEAPELRLGEGIGPIVPPPPLGLQDRLLLQLDFLLWLGDDLGGAIPVILKEVPLVLDEVALEAFLFGVVFV